MKVDKKILVPAGIAVAAIGIYFLTKPKADAQSQLPSPTPTNTGSTVASIDKNKLLKRGINGAETVELQKLLGVGADGIFGAQTEAALVGKKGVTQTTLNQYPNLPNINPNPLAIGDKIMANVREGTPVYDAHMKADGSYYSEYTIKKRVDYGQSVGIIRALNATKTWYFIEFPNFLGTSNGFVKALDVVRIK